MRREVRSILGLLLVFATVPLARAQQSETDGRLESARYFFHQGVELLLANQPERALDFFLRSRELVPSAKNTIDAGICLERLGRHDEALELYEDASARF